MNKILGHNKHGHYSKSKKPAFKNGGIYKQKFMNTNKLTVIKRKIFVAF